MYFWIPLIWVLVIWQVIQPQFAAVHERLDGGTDLKVKTGYCILLFLVPFIIAAFRIEFGDTGSYIRAFERIVTGWDNFTLVVKEDTKSQLFVGLEFIFKTYISKKPQVWLGFLVLVQSVFFLKTLKKYSPDVGMSVYMYVATAMMFNWMCNGARQCTAVMICFACTGFLLKKKWYIYYPILLVVMGLTPITNELGKDPPVWFLGGIHQSVIILILASFCMTGKAFNIKVWIAAGIFAVLAVTGGLDSVLSDAVENTTYINDLKYAQADSGTSMLRVLVEMIPMVLALMARRYILENDAPPIIHLSCNASVMTSVLYMASALTSGIYVGRLPIYTEMYNLILVPWLIRHPFKKNKQMFTIIFILFYMAYFFYQVSIQWRGMLQVGIWEG